jgi:hypothetical protein
MRIEILREAQEDLEAGSGFYEEMGPGLGSIFLESLIADIEAIPRYAGVHVSMNQFYRALAKRFPFAIY